MPSYEISQSDLYKGKGQPHLIEAINSLYIEPERAMRRLKEYSSLFTGAVNIAILYLLIILIYFGFLLLSILAFEPPDVGIGQLHSLLSMQFIFSFFMNVMIGFGVLISTWLFASLVYWLPAKLLKGKSEYVQQASILSYVMLALFPLGLFSSLLGLIPLLGPFIALLSNLIVFFYSLFIIFLSIREINEFSNLKAIISLLISTALFMIIGLILLLFFMLLFSFSLPFIGNLPHQSF